MWLHVPKTLLKRFTSSLTRWNSNDRLTPQMTKSTRSQTTSVQTKKYSMKPSLAQVCERRQQKNWSRSLHLQTVETRQHYVKPRALHHAWKKDSKKQKVVGERHHLKGNSEGGVEAHAKCLRFNQQLPRCQKDWIFDSKRHRISWQEEHTFCPTSSAVQKLLARKRFP